MSLAHVASPPACHTPDEIPAHTVWTRLAPICRITFISDLKFLRFWVKTVVPKALLLVLFGFGNNKIYTIMLFWFLHAGSTSLLLVVTVGHKVSSKENILTLIFDQNFSDKLSYVPQLCFQAPPVSWKEVFSFIPSQKCSTKDKFKFSPWLLFSSYDNQKSSRFPSRTCWFLVWAPCRAPLLSRPAPLCDTSSPG